MALAVFKVIDYLFKKRGYFEKVIEILLFEELASPSSAT